MHTRFQQYSRSYSIFPDIKQYLHDCLNNSCQYISSFASIFIFFTYELLDLWIHFCGHIQVCFVLLSLHPSPSPKNITSFQVRRNPLQWALKDFQKYFSLWKLVLQSFLLQRPFLLHLYTYVIWLRRYERQIILD